MYLTNATALLDGWSQPHLIGPYANGLVQGGAHELTAGQERQRDHTAGVIAENTDRAARLEIPHANRGVPRSAHQLSTWQHQEIPD